MSAYSEFNTEVRKKYNSLDLQYNGEAVKKFYEEEYDTADGAHARLLTFINEPDSNEVGFNSSETLTGFVQIIISLPTSDSGLNYFLNNLADQIGDHFPRSNFVSGDLKIEWLNTQRETPLRVNGFYSVTVRVNFRAFSC
ncbi:tail-completion protein [Vibrio phage 1.206.O._10N.222.51.B10]|nr:tail-completion protein [Vibrio phage 1.206.O._10N.222.51.B10]